MPASVRSDFIHIASERLDRGIWMISVAGLDSYREGLEETAAQDRLRNKLDALFRAQGMQSFDPVADSWRMAVDTGYFFGATPDSWIGRLWPRGRAQYRHSGSEVSIESNRNVYLCCMKTKKAIGSLLDEPLETILERLNGNPVYEAISTGHPERMGIQRGWTVDRFFEKSTMRLPPGCYRFHEEVLGGLKAGDLISISQPA